MKKTVKINISGIVFHFDEDAYVILNNYLTAINKHFESDKEGKEIIADIEYRIAELLQMKLNEQKQVINIDDINEVIDIMGNPDQFEVEDEPSANVFGESESTRRLYRDTDSGVIGGVCSGLGAYFNISPLIFRVIFIVFTLSSFIHLYVWISMPILVYVILWIVMPPAKTTAEKLSMKGENLTLTNIEKSVRNEYENVRQNFTKMRSSREYNKSKEFANNVGKGIGDVLMFFLKFIMVIIGIALILGGIGMITGIFGAFVFSEPIFFWGNVDMHSEFLPDFLYSFLDPNSVVIGSICLFLVVVIPIFAIIYGGLKLILRFKANDKFIAGFGFITWFICVLILAGIVIVEVKDYVVSVKVDDTEEIDLFGDQTLRIEAADYDDTEISSVYIFGDRTEFYMDDENRGRIYLAPELRIYYTNDDEISIRVQKEGRGRDNYVARRQAADILYEWELDGSILTLDPFYYLEEGQKWSFPEVDIIIYIPEGQRVYLDESLYEMMDYVETAEDIWRHDLWDEEWIMTDDGLDEPKNYKKRKELNFAE